MGFGSIFQSKQKKIKSTTVEKRIQMLEREVEVLKKMNRKLNFTLDLLLKQNQPSETKVQTADEKIKLIA
jgi:predicted  nucleic acid-binding Zn-ribbon protein